MEFLRPKIIVKKDEEGNYILKKKANISLILSLLILFFLIFKGLKRMEKMEYLFNIKYIGTNIVAFFIFFLYFYVIFFKDNIQIQANTGLGEDEVFYFGAIIGFEGYKKFCEIFRKVTNRDRANIYFLEEENESYNV